MNTSFRIGAMLAAVIAGSASAATVNVQLIGGSSHNPDGPGGQGNTHSGYFRLTVADTTGLGAGQVGGDIQAGRVFTTFCIEIGETLANGNHVFDVNTSSILGGTSPFVPQPLVSQTAFLYTTFRAGAITSLAGVGSFDTSSNADLNALQDALWFFQNQLGVTDVDDNNTVVLGAKAQALADAANDAVANGAYGWGGGIGNVRILNMGGPAGQYDFGASQDVLALVPLPQGVGMASIGLLVLGARRRRAL